MVEKYWEDKEMLTANPTNGIMPSLWNAIRISPMDPPGILMEEGRESPHNSPVILVPVKFCSNLNYFD